MKGSFGGCSSAVLHTRAVNRGSRLYSVCTVHTPSFDSGAPKYLSRRYSAWRLMAMYPAARIQGIYAKMPDWGLTFVRCHPLSSRAQNRVDLLTRLNQCIAGAHLVFPARR